MFLRVTVDATGSHTILPFLIRRTIANIMGHDISTSTQGDEDEKLSHNPAAAERFERALTIIRAQVVT